MATTSKPSTTQQPTSNGIIAPIRNDNSTPKSPTTPIKQKQTQKQRLVFLFMNLIGQVVDVQVRDGSIYEGLFHAANIPLEDNSAKQEFGIILHAVRVKSKNISSAVQQQSFDTMLIKDYDIVQINATVVFAREKDHYKDEQFSTDSEITKTKEIAQRELVKWQADEDTEMVMLEESTSFERNWDQFKANHDKFGVRSTYNENLYTIEIDKSSHFYQKMEKKAAKLAEEIENDTTVSNIHMKEERGLISETDATEEELYSSVTREGEAKKYVPPQKRATDDKQKKEHLSSPAMTSLRNSPLFQSITPGHVPDAPEDLKKQLMQIRKTVQPKKTSSPVMGPVSAPKSPIPSSPLIGDKQRIDGLSLEPHVPDINEDQRKDYVDFQKHKIAQKRAADTESLKNFSKDLKVKQQTPNSNPSTPITTPAPQLPVVNTAPEQPQPQAKVSILGTLKKQRNSVISNQPPTVGQQQASPAKETVQPAATTTTTPSKPTITPPTTPPKTDDKKPASKLNPNAKEFKFNVNAKTYTPSMPVMFQPPIQFIPMQPAPPPASFGVSWTNQHVELAYAKSLLQLYNEAMKKQMNEKVQDKVQWCDAKGRKSFTEVEPIAAQVPALSTPPQQQQPPMFVPVPHPAMGYGVPPMRPNAGYNPYGAPYQQQYQHPYQQQYQPPYHQ